MEHKIRVERVKSVDGNLLNDLKRKFIPGRPDGKSGEWNLENIKTFLDTPNTIFLLGYVGDEVAGMISAYVLPRMDSNKSEVFFYEIGVNENYRGKGVARKLIERLKQIAKDEGIKEMFVLTNRSNIPAMNLYKSTGGVEEEEKDGVMFTYKL